MDFLKDFTLLIARAFISSLYIWAAMAKVFNWSGTISYMKLKRMPYSSLFLPLAIFIQILGGVSICLGFYPRLGALLLILFTIPAAYVFHDFWNLEGTERVTEKTFFMKDIAILGGLLLLLVWGGGRFSLSAL